MGMGILGKAPALDTVWWWRLEHQGGMLQRPVSSLPESDLIPLIPGEFVRLCGLMSLTDTHEKVTESYSYIQFKIKTAPEPAFYFCFVLNINTH